MDVCSLHRRSVRSWSDVRGREVAVPKMADGRG